MKEVNMKPKNFQNRNFTLAKHRRKPFPQHLAQAPELPNRYSASNFLKEITRAVIEEGDVDMLRIPWLRPSVSTDQSTQVSREVSASNPTESSNAPEPGDDQNDQEDEPGFILHHLNDRYRVVPAFRLYHNGTIPIRDELGEALQGVANSYRGDNIFPFITTIQFLIVDAYNESGFNPNAEGDFNSSGQPTSYGFWQLHSNDQSTYEHLKQLSHVEYGEYMGEYLNSCLNIYSQNFVSEGGNFEARQPRYSHIARFIMETADDIHATSEQRTILYPLCFLMIYMKEGLRDSASSLLSNTGTTGYGPAQMKNKIFLFIELMAHLTVERVS